jgi:hypothetical protein
MHSHFYVIIVDFFQVLHVSCSSVNLIAMPRPNNFVNECSLGGVFLVCNFTSTAYSIKCKGLRVMPVCIAECTCMLLDLYNAGFVF